MGQGIASGNAQDCLRPRAPAWAPVSGFMVRVGRSSCLIYDLTKQAEQERGGVGRGGWARMPSKSHSSPPRKRGVQSKRLKSPDSCLRGNDEKGDWRADRPNSCPASRLIPFVRATKPVAGAEFAANLLRMQQIGSTAAPVSAIPRCPLPRSSRPSSPRKAAIQGGHRSRLRLWTPAFAGVTRALHDRPRSGGEWSASASSHGLR